MVRTMLSPRMNRLWRCVAVAAVMVWPVVRAGAAERRDERPNILLVLLDDLGKEWIGAYGAEGVKTPRIDRLAARGTRFENFYVMPQCTPTRLSLLTGQYPFRHGWVNHWDVPRWGGGAHYDWTMNPSIAAVMRSAGYRTAVAGKWQINDFRVQPEAMRELGFDDYCMWTGGQGNDPPSQQRYWDPYIHTAAGSATRPGSFGDDVFADFLIDFMRRHREHPMFLYFPMCLPHEPLVATPLDPGASSRMERHRAMVRYADALIGRLADELEALNLEKDTLLIVTTDNGTSSAISGLRHGRVVRGGKSSTSEAGVCVPFIVHAPGRVAQGKVSHALLTIADLLPTFAELARTAPPPEFVYDGRPAAAALLGEADRSPHEWILAMGGKNEARLTPAGVENAYVFRDRVIRNERFKLYVDSARRPDKLFDLLEDPFEEVNLIDRPEPEIRAARERLAAVIPEFPERDQDPIYRPLPPQPWDVPVSAESETWKK